jgi:hypothetical protein
MNRETLLKRPNAKKTDDVKIEDEIVAKVRKLTADEVEYMNKNYKGDEKSLEGCRFIVARCVVDEAGNPIFKDEDINADIKKMDHELVDAIATKALTFSGIKTQPKND